ncbi:MAG TPA: hypothetical protein EYP57_03570 [Thermodesulfobacteriaceae bacterium]|nr:hypothetical protein [Thermodesulfobacteriaceae bacterium]
MLTSRAIAEFHEYLSSGRWEEDFGYRTPDGQGEMLDLVESLFELCELADTVLTRRLYQQMGGHLGKKGILPVD